MTEALRFEIPAAVRPGSLYSPLKGVLPDKGDTGYVECTPDLCARLLAIPVPKRSLKKGNRQRLGRAMRSGRFRTNAESVVLDVNDGVLDRHHRFKMVVETGIPQVMLVARGLPTEVFHTIDTGSGRSRSDVLTISGRKNGPSLSSALSWLWRHAHLDWNQRPASYPDHEDLLNLTRAYPGLEESCVEVLRLHRNSGRSPCAPSTGWFAYFHYLIGRLDPARRRPFLEQVCEGIGVVRNTPAEALRRRLNNAGPMGTDKADDVERMAWAWKAFSTFRTGRGAKVVKWTSVESFPEIPFPLPEVGDVNALFPDLKASLTSPATVPSLAPLDP